MRFIPIVLIFVAGLVLRQQDSGLTVNDVEIITESDAFGQQIHVAQGLLVNEGTMAYTSIDIFADVFDNEDEIIGEGFGFPVNACGSGLLNFALQPGQSQLIRVPLELFEDEVEVDHVEMLPEGQKIEPSPEINGNSLVGIIQISEREVVNLEWIDETNGFMYGVGCDADVFSQLQWYEYDPEDDASNPVAHPDTARVTGALLQQLGLTDLMHYERSFLTFAPTGRRIVYQTDINTVLTAEPDGSFKRLIYDDLGRRSLHGFIWLPQGRFLAYYYGAYGEEVSYYTASIDGQHISADVYNVTPSMTIPGPTPDGAKVVITNTIEDQTGYFLKDAFFPAAELLFETDEIPGNNYPAPLYTTNAAGETYIYIVRPIENTPLLQCFDMQSRQLNDLTALPINLTTDDRAWTWLSPDGSTIALAANGVHGGLWLIDPDEFGGCGVELAG